jgi:outer membrane protein assembly factor BamB
MPRETAGLFLVLLAVLPVAADEKEELWAAARKGDAKAVESLLAKGVDVNAKTPYGATALVYAAGAGHLDAVKVLLKHKADVDAKDTFYKTNALGWALSKRHFEVVKALVEAGADGIDAVLLNAASTGRADLVRAVLDNGKFKPESPGTALVNAVKADRIAVVQLLLEKGKVKQEALDKALTATPAERPEIAALLKKAGAKLAPKNSLSVDEKSLVAFAGTYLQEESGTELTGAVDGGKLVLKFGDRPLYTLEPIDNVTFQPADNDEIKISFKRDGEKVVGLAMKRGTNEATYRRIERPIPSPTPKNQLLDEKPVQVTAPLNWPSFRGPNASGVADGQFPPLIWDAEKSINIQWKTPIPGLGHSCPIIWGDRVFITTAISGDSNTKLRVGLYGDVDSVNDPTSHCWRVYSLDKHTGKILWERTAREGVPKIKRHTKGSHANATAATDGRRVVVNFGSEGMYCYDFDGNLLWKRELGVLDSGFFFDADSQWGFGSSPIIYQDRVMVQCDVGKNSFIAAYNLDDGRPIWRTPREEIPSWGTPTIYAGKTRAELITNATKFVRGYDPLTGKELWRLSRNAEITVPTPVIGHGLIYVTSGYAPVQPIYAIRPGATGDISLKDGKESNEFVAWSKTRGGPYMTTPIIYGDFLYTCANAGMLTCYDAKTGKQIYRERLGGKGGYTASPVAADGKLYFTGEESGVRVVKAGPQFELLAVNPLGDVCLATPAISDGMIFIRTQHFLLAIARQAHAKAPGSS